MNLEKKTFDGIYLDYYSRIKSHGNSSVLEISSYSPVKNSIGDLPWKGESKDAVQNNVSNIDTICDAMHSLIEMLIKKTKIVYHVLYPDLVLLKETIQKYNDTIDAIIATLAQIESEEARLAELNKKQEGGDNSDN